MRLHFLPLLLFGIGASCKTLESENEIDIDSLDESDILDIVQNFIAEKDPILELFLSLCFLHPKCYQLQMPFHQEADYEDNEENLPSPPKLDSRQKKELWGHLKARRTESARSLLVGLIKQVEASSKKMMFRYIQQGVAERGVSVVATKNIIDAVKGVWLSATKDLEEAKTNIEELFYLLPMDSESERRTLLSLVGSLKAIPAHLDVLYQRALEEGYQNYVKSGSWNSWKREE